MVGTIHGELSWGAKEELKMPEMPLLGFLPPAAGIVPKRKKISRVRFPTHGRQAARLAPKLNRIAEILTRPNATVELKSDPTGLAPERVIVFEVADSIKDFAKAIEKVPGFAFMQEEEALIRPDDDFALLDDRINAVSDVRFDKDVPARLYTALPDLAALSEFLSMWKSWSQGRQLNLGFAPFEHLFRQVRTIRPWGPLDRVPLDTVKFWQDRLIGEEQDFIRSEVEFWFQRSQRSRQTAIDAVAREMARIGGRLVSQHEMPMISYHGALIDIPTSEVFNLVADPFQGLGTIDEIMFLRPQAILTAPLEVPSDDFSDWDREELGTELQLNPPIAALLDGMPIASHHLLRERLIIDDPLNYEENTTVDLRRHGTSMASVILHGDRNLETNPISRTLLVRPIMTTSDNGPESTDNDRLIVDIVHEAIVRIKGDGKDIVGVAPQVFIVNLSVGVEHRPFAGVMSPLARLIDYLAYRFQLLFIISAGNVEESLSIPESNWTEFQDASADDREFKVIQAVDADKHIRTLISPAESINALTVGSVEQPITTPVHRGAMDVAPYHTKGMPIVSSGLGLGFRRSVKPDILVPAGTQALRFHSSLDSLCVRVVPGGVGVRSAMPDASRRGRLDQESNDYGTSVSAALTTRAAHFLFDAAIGNEHDSPLTEIDPSLYAVTVKSLLVHRAKWSDAATRILEICGPHGGHRHSERSENVTRFLGYGIPNFEEAGHCLFNRATLVAAGRIRPDQSLRYSLPLPASLVGVTDPRTLTITVAWLTPIRSTTQAYRGVRIEGGPKKSGDLWVGDRESQNQPSSNLLIRGTVFHQRYVGAHAMAYEDGESIPIDIWCKADAGADEPDVAFGLVVSLETEVELPIYDEVRNRLMVRIDQQG